MTAFQTQSGIAIFLQAQFKATALAKMRCGLFTTAGSKPTYARRTYSQALLYMNRKISLSVLLFFLYLVQESTFRKNKKVGCR